jgi:hypothetical protein
MIDAGPLSLKLADGMIGVGTHRLSGGMMKRPAFWGVSLLIVYFAMVFCDDSAPIPDEFQTENTLAIIYPQMSTELVGGQSFRVTTILKNDADEPIEAALVEAELWTPEEERSLAIPCFDQGNGRYLSDPVTLPLKNSQGIWRVSARAVSGNEVIAQGEGHFIGQSSYSERLQRLLGFWIEPSDLFPYNVPGAEDPLLKTYAYENGGYVILAGNPTSAVMGISFVILDVHWRQMDFPEDEISAKNHVLNLAGPHRITLDASTEDLIAEQDTFRGWPAWKVTGWWNPNIMLGDLVHEAPLDWVIFQCPGSEWLWTILITTNEIELLDDLQSIRDTFECSLG